VAGAGAALILLSPLLLVAGAAIRLETPGPVLFRQRRVGARGREFDMWKFRTMCDGAEQQRAELVAASRAAQWLDLEHDPRVTRVGRVLRRTSIDELPQLWNVLRGDMSLVGPRPLIPVEDEAVPAWAGPRRHVTPGMTGLWQVSGRASLPFEAMLELDAAYVRAWSLRRDVEILGLTAAAVISRRGAR
jgi:lipopolysaccharide/colanic/teichoic acid biosynthesis glycosyltransferase